MSDRMHYFDMAMFPMYFGFTTSEKAFQREMRRLKVASPPKWVSDGAGATTHMLDNERRNSLCIVCIDLRGSHSKAATCGLLAHEAVHVYQQLLQETGEKQPGIEFEAYTIQYITQCMISVVFPEKARK